MLIFQHFRLFEKHYIMFFEHDAFGGWPLRFRYGPV